MKEFVDRVERLTEEYLDVRTINDLLRNAVEELGEFAKAVSVEDGFKKKKLKESSIQEGVDVVICALSLYFARGGNTAHLTSYAKIKLDKWERNIGDFK